MVGSNVTEYTKRFNALARLLPYLVTPESQKVNRYIWGLDSRIRGLVKATQPTMMKSAMELAAIVIDDHIRSGEFKTDRDSGKRKAGDGTKHVVYVTEGSEEKRGRKDQKRQNLDKGYKAYQGTHPWCARCNRHHQGQCRNNVCYNCKKPGHMARDCKAPNSGVCYECGSVNHFRKNCPKLGGRGEDEAQGRAFVMDRQAAIREPDMGTGTF